MEPVFIVLIPGLIGGLVLAVLIAVTRLRTPSVVVSRRLAAPSPTLINMAHIRVEGIGGLGMVAAVVVVALTDPSIRLAMIVALVLGVGLALFLIAARRRSGVEPTGDGPEDGSLLRLDGERRRTPLGGVRGRPDAADVSNAVRFAQFKSFA